MSAYDSIFVTGVKVSLSRKFESHILRRQWSLHVCNGFPCPALAMVEQMFGSSNQNLIIAFVIPLAQSD